MLVHFGGWKWPLVAGLILGVLTALAAAYLTPIVPGHGSDAVAQLVAIAFVSGTVAAIAARLLLALVCRIRSAC
jgi:hypothetical protein